MFSNSNIYYHLIGHFCDDVIFLGAMKHDRLLVLITSYGKRGGCWLNCGPAQGGPGTVTRKLETFWTVQTVWDGPYELD